MKRKRLLLVSGILLLLFLLVLLTYRDPFRKIPISTALFDQEGGLLGARVAADGQWRFGKPDTLPDKYVKCVIAFEDRHFYQHPGVNPLAIIRALYQNIKSGEIVSGGSTISMQVIRLSRNNRPRTIGEKLVEMYLAVQLELKNTKSEILRYYAGYAPFGGNVVGLEAACWRYFGRSPKELSWSEAATLAVLPNAPALIHPGRNRKELMEKRNRLLHYLYSKGEMDSLTCDLAISEALPAKPLDLPDRAPHLLDFYRQSGNGRVQTQVKSWLQDRSGEIVRTHQTKLARNQIFNMAVLVLDNKSGEILAYQGNVPDDGSSRHGHQVDIIRSSRSSGSILKPFLYAGMLEAGLILPGTLIPDIPTRYANFTPHNFNKEYDGAVHADEALIRSLNVPAVRMLKEFGVVRFYDQLKNLGLSTLHRSADQYGLSLILGGAEVSLWDVCQAYSSLARGLEEMNTDNFSPASIYLTFDAMKRVKRPDSEAGWEHFQSASSFAWKTGTSFGYRDAWAIGVNPDYTVGVWVGNADGEGRPGLTGLSVAAPVLFDLVNFLPSGSWFDTPNIQLSEAVVCRESGMRATENCPDTDTVLIPEVGYRTPQCPYHQNVALDQSGLFRVHGDCYPVLDMVFKKYFVLPPGMASYYSGKHANYRPLPAWYSTCRSTDKQAIEVIYPHAGEQVFLPMNASGKQESLLIEVVHQSTDAKIFWFLDEDYIGFTDRVHKMELQPDAGDHLLSLTDENGNSTSRKFSVR